MQEAVKLVKASAGSGKTYNLTRQYIRMLLQGDEYSYRHILAVTFTNKATGEMKSRIIEELDRMAGDTSNPDAAAARSRLCRILNDYSGFSVSTIDKFFQSVMRSFAREIGKFASYKVELDTDSVVERAIDILLDSLDDPVNASLLEWLGQYSFKRVEEGGSWDISGALKETAKLFFREDFKLNRESFCAADGDRSKIREFDDRMDKIVREFRKSAKELGQSVMDYMKSQGIAPEDFKYKSKSPFTVFRKLAGGEIVRPSMKLYDSFLDYETPELRSLVDRTVELFDREWENYVSAGLIRSNLFLLGIYSDIWKNLNGYLRDNNTVLLSESLELLDRIIDGNDTPFIYEKTGVRYNHIMLDEAQDTSLLQWRNFSPLFQENIASGNDNLIVGDIKQSIYRWRGSDWRLMSEYVFRDLGEKNVNGSESLSENWRSCRSIVDFNTRVFSEMERMLTLGGIYADCRQTVPEKHSDWAQGRVKIGFIDDKEWRGVALDRMYSDLLQLREAGYGYSDITVLVRRNSEGSDVAKYLMSKNISVITEDSLLIGASPVTAALLDILRYIVNPDDSVNRIAASAFAESTEQYRLSGSLYDICQELLSGPLFDIRPGDVPFVQALLDCVVSWQEKYGSSLRGFIRWWDEAGCRKSISVTEGGDAVRIMTIHKSKGLGLEAVIIPFLEESFSGKGHSDNVLWCRAKGSFSDMGLLPVKACRQMGESIFREQYEQEVFLNRVDCVNTAYVAMTRPVSQLIAYAPTPGDRKTSELNSFSAALHSVLKDDLNGEGIFISGNLEPFVRKADKVDCLIQDSFEISPVGERLTLSLHGADYFEQEYSPRLRGIELHDILSRVDREEDLEKACGDDTASFWFLSGHLEKVRDRHWFDGTYRSVNESSIVDGSGTVYRPDRILTDDAEGHAIVIDYKFGSRRKKHIEQIENYVSLLHGTGYGKVDAYLWYVADDEIIDVNYE